MSKHVELLDAIINEIKQSTKFINEENPSIDITVDEDLLNKISSINSTSKSYKDKKIKLLSLIKTKIEKESSKKSKKESAAPPSNNLSETCKDIITTLDIMYNFEVKKWFIKNVLKNENFDNHHKLHRGFISMILSMDNLTKKDIKEIGVFYAKILKEYETNKPVLTSTSLNDFVKNPDDHSLYIRPYKTLKNKKDMEKRVELFNNHLRKSYKKIKKEHKNG